MQTPTIRERFFYGFLALPLAFAGMPLYVQAPDLYATEHGLSLTLMGVILLGVRLFDAFQDPLIGYLSDRFSAKRAHVQYAAMAMMAAGMMMLFSAPQGSVAVWFAGSLIVATTAFSILSINLATLGSLRTAHPDAQTRLTSAREAFGLVGILIAAVLPEALKTIMPAPAAFMTMAGLVTALLLVAAMCFGSWWRGNRTQLLSQGLSHQRPTAKSMMDAARHQKAFYSIYGISLLASSIPAVLVLFFIRDRLMAESQSGLFLGLYFAAGLIGMPLWVRAANAWGHARAWRLSMLIAMGAFIWASQLGAGATTAFAIICIASGMALGAELVLPPAMLALSVHKAGHQNVASSQFAILAFLSKLALAIAAGVTLPFLQKAGYTPAAVNSEQALVALSFTYALFPCLLKGLAVAGLTFFLQQQQRHLT